MEVFVLTTTAAGALGLAYAIQKAALNALFRIMQISNPVE